MTQQSNRRPERFVKPAYWSDAPAPAPAPATQADIDAEPEPLSPTRYGDWVLNGIAIDF